MKPKRKERTVATSIDDFRSLVNQQESAGIVAESLQLGGDFPQCTPDTATVADWQHALTERLADLFEQCRFDESGLEVRRNLRTRLARIVALCEAWDKQLR